MTDVAETQPVLTRLTQIIAVLCRAVQLCSSPRYGLGRNVATVPPDLLIPIWRRLQRAGTRIRALLVRMRAGKLYTTPHRTRRATPPAPNTTTSSNTPPTTRPPRVLPHHFAWLCPMVPSDAAVYGNHLRILMAEPEMQELLAATPQAARILRPVYRMLGLEPKLLIPTLTHTARISDAPSAAAPLTLPARSDSLPAPDNALPPHPCAGGLPGARLLVPG